MCLRFDAGVYGSPLVLSVRPQPPLRDVGTSTAILGRATELRAQAELLERGFAPLIPLVDVGADFIVGDKWIQVKGSSLQSSSKQYVFRFKRGLNADVYLLRGVQDDVWWVIPVRVLKTLGVSNGLAIRFAERTSSRGRPSRIGEALREYIGAWWVIDSQDR